MASRRNLPSTSYLKHIVILLSFHQQIAPAEFEALLLQHGAVRAAGVVGAPHARHGEVPVAFVVLQPGATATEEELVQHVNTRVSTV